MAMHRRGQANSYVLGIIFIQSCVPPLTSLLLNLSAPMVLQPGITRPRFFWRSVFRRDWDVV